MQHAAHPSIAEAPEPPWYRQGWPWFIISFPAMSVVLGIMMIVLAVRTDDALVVDDWYREGKSINRRIERDHAAARLGVHANVRNLSGAIAVDLGARDAAFVPPAALRLEWVHVIDADRDGAAELVAAGGGRYVAPDAALPDGGRWRLHLAPVDAPGKVAADSPPPDGEASGPEGDVTIALHGWRLVSDVVPLGEAEAEGATRLAADRGAR